jgi:hypothetical protein
LLYKGWHAAANLRDLDHDGLACYYASSWFKTCCIILDVL